MVSEAGPAYDASGQHAAGLAMRVTPRNGKFRLGPDSWQNWAHATRAENHARRNAVIWRASPAVGLFGLRFHRRSQACSGPTVTTMTPSSLIRNAIVGRPDAGARPTACWNAAVSSWAASRGTSAEFAAQTGAPSDVSAIRSARRSTSQQIPCASARQDASKASVGLQSMSRTKT
jgi:hypothetical protein